MVRFIILTREARRPARSVYFNLFRVQRRKVCAYSGFRILLVSVASLLSVTVAAFAADIKVKVVDPQGAAVAGAQVSLDALADVALVHVVRNTAADGMVAFLMKAAWRGCRIQVLAPGFAGRGAAADYRAGARSR